MTRRTVVALIILVLVVAIALTYITLFISNTAYYLIYYEVNPLENKCIDFIEIVNKTSNSEHVIETKKIYSLCFITASLKLEMLYRNNRPIKSFFTLTIYDPTIKFYTNKNDIIDQVLKYYGLSRDSCILKGSILSCSSTRIVLRKDYDVSVKWTINTRDYSRFWIWSVPVGVNKTIIPITYKSIPNGLAADLLLFDKDNLAIDTRYKGEKLVVSRPILVKKISILNPSPTTYNMVKDVIADKPECSIVKNTSNEIRVCCGRKLLDLYKNIAEKLPWKLSEEYKTITGNDREVITIINYNIVFQKTKYRILKSGNYTVYWDQEHRILFSINNTLINIIPPLDDLLTPPIDLAVGSSPRISIELLLMEYKKSRFSIGLSGANYLFTSIGILLVIVLVIVLYKRVFRR